MASLPPVPKASYWQYKDDTSYVLKWIDQTAKTCGWKRQQAKHKVPELSSSGSRNTPSIKKKVIPTNEPSRTNTMAGSGRLKGKDRKAAKQAAAAAAAAAIEKQKRDEDERGIVLSVLEILEQANLISTCPPSSATRPPSSVMHALGRAIKLRKRFSDWFEVTRPDDHKSNSAHHYFLKVLEQIADLFLQTTGKASVNLDEANTGHAKSGTNRTGRQNRYESLMEQAVQDEADFSQARSTSSSGSAIKEEATTSGRKYHIEVKDSQENAFMVFTLFTDLQDIKVEMKRMWERCFKDGADMVIATILTAQALAFVQRSEERIMSFLDDIDQQEGVSEQDGLRNGTWSFPGTYCRLLSTLRDPNDLQAVLRFENSNHTTGDKGDSIKMIDLTFAFTARRLRHFTLPSHGVCSDPLLLQVEHNPRALLNSNIYEVLERDRALCSILFELGSLNYVHHASSQAYSQGHSDEDRRFESIRKDPILCSLQPLWIRKEVNITSVFAAEIMLDIKEICDAFPASRPSYYDTYNSHMNSLDLEWMTVTAESGNAPVWNRSVIVPTQASPLLKSGLAGTDAWVSKFSEMLTKISFLFAISNTEDHNCQKVAIPAGTHLGIECAEDIPWEEQFDVDCERSLKLYAGLDPHGLDHSTEEYMKSRLFKYIWFPRNVNYLLDNYPMFTTFRQAFMETLTESIAIELLEAHKHGVGAIAHLYNASRQLGLGNLQWPAMDRLIELHKIALFAGEVPTTPAAMLKRFSHRYWPPKGRMSVKAKIRRMNRDITLMKTSAMTQAYDEHFQTTGRIPFWYTLESNALATAAEKKARKKGSTPVNASFIESMPAMEGYLAKQLQDVRVDYMEIERVTFDFNEDLLNHARAEFERQANRVLRNKDEDAWSGIDFVSESFEQEAQLHEAMSKCGGDPSKLPIQDCDYLQHSINCLAAALRAKGIGKGQTSADGEPVNMPISLTRFRIRGSDDLPDMSRLVLVSRCSCCHRKQYF